MKRLVFIFCAFVIVTMSFAQENVNSKKYNLFLTGASFATPNNGWFEIGCDKLNANPINKAKGGDAIANTANLMAEGKMYTKEELEIMDAFIIMHVHNMNVYDPSQLKEEITDYQLPFDRSNYAAAYDYVIKKYITDCYNLKFEPLSKYYGSKGGKPSAIILCTHWNDARVTYNESIRKLASKWGLPLIEFDKYIGFSKNQKHPVTKEPFSLLFTNDTQVMEGEKHGFHPVNGKDKYIQQRIGAIFYGLMSNILY